MKDGEEYVNARMHEYEPKLDEKKSSAQ